MNFGEGACVNYLVLLNEKLETIFSFGQEYGSFVPTATDEPVRPWEVCHHTDAEKTRLLYETVLNKKKLVMYCGTWANPSEPSIKRLYVCTAHWIGRSEITVALHATELPAEVARLSAREREILLHLGCGEPASEIAELLGVSESSVRTYMQRMREKLSLASVDDLVKLGGLIIAAHHGAKPKSLVTEGFIDPSILDNRRFDCLN